MSEATAQPVPRRRHRFPAGQSANPKGRPVGSRNKMTILAERLMGGDAEEVVRAAIEGAKNREPVPLRLCMERISPRLRHRPLDFELPAIVTVEDAERGSTALLAAIACGDVAPQEAVPIINALTAHVGLVEAGSQAKRLAEIEAKLAS